MRRAKVLRCLFPGGGRTQEGDARPSDGGRQEGASPTAPQQTVSDSEEEDIFEGAGRMYEDPAAARARTGSGASGAGGAAADRVPLFGNADRLADLPDGATCGATLGSLAE